MFLADLWKIVEHYFDMNELNDCVTFSAMVKHAALAKTERYSNANAGTLREVSLIYFRNLFMRCLEGALSDVFQLQSTPNF